MKPLVGEGREPLLVMFALWILALPVVVLSGLPTWVGYTVGGVVLIGGTGEALRRIERSHESR